MAAPGARLSAGSPLQAPAMPVRSPVSERTPASSHGLADAPERCAASIPRPRPTSRPPIPRRNAWASGVVPPSPESSRPDCAGAARTAAPKASRASAYAVVDLISPGSVDRAARSRPPGGPPRQPARHRPLVRAVLVAEAALEARLLVQHEPRPVDDEAPGGEDEQRGRAEERRLAEQHREDGRDHRVAHVAVGPGDHEALGRSHGASVPRPRRANRRTVQTHSAKPAAMRPAPTRTSAGAKFAPAPSRRMSAGTTIVTVPGRRAMARACRHTRATVRDYLQPSGWPRS